MFICFSIGCLIPEVMTLLCIVSIVAMKATIPFLITPSSLRPDRVGGPEELFVPDIEENLRPSRVEQDRERPGHG
ncbi:hypothetical protein BHM03_00016405 [Ensete ventricosum]|nr:hypothetical protein BHM03_00016405 [Ensete ventricosum]